MEVNQDLYEKLLNPSKTRSGILPITTIPIEKRRFTHKIIMNPYNRVNNVQGFKSSEFYDADSDAGKYYYIHIYPYDFSYDTIINEVSPIIINPNKFECQSFYNYMVISIIGRNKNTNKSEILSKPRLYVVKVINMFEFGTKHHQILYRIALQDKELFNELMKSYNKIEYVLYAAGEIMCDNNSKLFFNFYSGTYKMKRHISKRRSIYEAAYIVYLLNQNALKYTNICFQHCGILNSDILKLTKKEISRLRNHNIRMLLFNTQDECRTMCINVIRYKYENKIDFITYENLQLLYRKIMY
jgi:hypothetical protein